MDQLLEFNERKVLKNTGTVSRKQMKSRVYEIYDEFDKKRKEYDAKQADLEDLKLLEDKIKKREE